MRRFWKSAEKEFFTDEDGEALGVPLWGQRPSLWSL